MSEKVKSIDRLLNLMVTLRHARQPGLTTAEVISRVSGYGDAYDETTRKCFQRDRRLLTQIGWQVESTRVGTEVFYRIKEPSSFTPEVTLSLEEASFLAALPDALPKTENWRNLRVAVLRLLSSVLLQDQGKTAGHMASLISGNYGIGLNSLPLLQAAIRSRSTASFVYLSQQSQETRTVDGWSIWPYQGALYLVGYDHSRGEKRTFRLSRIVSEVKLGKPGSYEITPDQARIEPFTAPAITVQVKATPGTVPQLFQMATKFEPANGDATGDAEAMLLTLPQAPLDYWVARLSEFAGQMEIVSPPSLRHQIETRLDDLVARLENGA